MKNIFSTKKKILLKEPAGIFLSEVLINKFDFKIIVTMRHPAAIANSRKKLGWRMNYEWLTCQNDFYKDYFKRYEKNLNNFDKNIVTESGFHWLLFYSYIIELKNEYPNDILIIRHEDLSLEPIKYFKKAYDFIDLDFRDNIKQKIIEITSGNNIEMKTNDVGKLEKRNSEKLVFKWKNKLIQSEVDLLKNITRDYSLEFYTDDKFWNLETNNKKKEVKYFEK